MKIWVDADSCPKPVRDTIIRAAARTGIAAFFVANRQVPSLAGKHVHFRLCPEGPDAADDYIVSEAEKGDLAVTRDVPLAQRLVLKEVTTINDRGTHYTEENINERLSLRNFTVALARNGLEATRDRGYDARALKRFADIFDRELARLSRSVLS